MYHRAWYCLKVRILTHSLSHPVRLRGAFHECRYAAEFAKRGVKLIAISCDPVSEHVEWTKDICASQGVAELGFPIIADKDRTIVTELGMLDPDERTAEGIPMPARAVFIVKPNKTLALSILYPATTGRNFDELLRVVDSLQLTANFKVATPANWVHGDNVMVRTYTHHYTDWSTDMTRVCQLTPGVSNAEAEEKFPKGFEVMEVPSGKAYLRLTPQPNID